MSQDSMRIQLLKQLQEKMNDDQKAVLELVLNGQKVCAVEGVPGCGKTHTLTHLLVFLVGGDFFQLSEILGITFTVKAACEMKERVSKLLTDLYPEDFSKEFIEKNLQLRTFHSFCLNSMKEAGVITGFSIYDERESLEIINNLLLADAEFNKTLQTVPPERRHKFIEKKMQEIKSHISILKNDCKNVKDYEADYHLREKYPGGRFYKSYQETLKQNNALDFDDLLLVFYEKMITDLGFQQKMQQRYRFVLIDEFQDTNQIQIEIMQLLMHADNYLYVFGDADQSIYEWRLGNPRFLVNFEKNYPGAVKHYLSRNYRNVPKIVDNVFSLISNNSVRSNKPILAEKTGSHASSEQFMFDDVRITQANNEEDEAQLAVRWIQTLLNQAIFQKGDIAILARTHKTLQAVMRALSMANIDYITAEGHSFFTNKYIRGLIAYLKLLNNPDDDLACEMALKFPPRGVGKETLKELKENAHKRKLSLFAYLETCVESDETIIAVEQSQNHYDWEDGVEPQGRRKNKAKSKSKSKSPNKQDDNQGSLFGSLFAVKAPASSIIFASTISNKVQAEIRKFVQCVHTCNSYDSLVELCKGIWTKSGFKSWLEKLAMTSKSSTKQREYQEAIDRVAVLMERVSQFESEQWAEYQKLTLPQKVAQYLEEIILSHDQDDITAVDAVKLLTLHASKGLEFPVVLILGLEDTLFPFWLCHEDDRLRSAQSKIEEERRLLYVGMTRAEWYLTLFFSCHRIGDREARKPSRFLAELPIQL